VQQNNCFTLQWNCCSATESQSAVQKTHNSDVKLTDVTHYLPVQVNSASVKSYSRWQLRSFLFSITRLHWVRPTAHYWHKLSYTNSNTQKPLSANPWTTVDGRMPHILLLLYLFLFSLPKPDVWPCWAPRQQSNVWVLADLEIWQGITCIDLM